MALFDFRKQPAPATAEQPPPAPVFATPGGMIPMEDLLRLVVDENASDLHLTVGSPPALRLNGRVVKLDVRPLVPEDTESLARAIAGEGNMQRVNEEGSVDFGFSFREQSRFRVSVYRQRGTIGVALRPIPNQILSLEQIGRPQPFRQPLNAPGGLILVPGPPCPGKPTTPPSMTAGSNPRP